ncbi:triple tyrosine motif-containing protein [Flavobacteriaceae bacterium M23B6Z8]
MKRSIGAICWLLVFLSYGQDLPPIVEYSPNEYGGGNQNWMLSQNSDKHIFAANNEGLLHFSGEKWRLYPSPNETIVRSVRAVGDRIYTGAYMEFGYWYFDDAKRLLYHSLSDQIKEQIIDEEQFWGIIAYDKWILFQSLDRIYLYNSSTEKIDSITPESGVLKIFKVGDSVFFQSNDQLLYEIKNGNYQLISSAPEIVKNRIINIFNTPEGFLIHTRNDGFFTYKSGVIERWQIEAATILEEANAYSSLQLKDGSFAIGTISRGILLLSSQGVLTDWIKQSEGLANNTVLSLYEDAVGNLWAGLDNGINCINLTAAIRSFSDDSGILGTVYASAFHHGNLYIGTNQGLFIRINDSRESFRLIEGTAGQVWSLLSYDDVLFCGHDLGTYLIEGNTATLLNSSSGVWNFTQIPSRPDMLIQGEYEGFSILKRTNGEWVYANKINGFDFSSKHFEMANEQQAFMSHEYKGVYQIKFDEEFQTVVNWKKYEAPKKGKAASILKYNDAIYYAFKEGVLKYNEGDDSFIKDTLMTRVFENDTYISGKTAVTKDNKLWVFTKDKIVYITSGKLSKEPVIHTISIPASIRNTITGYENVYLLSDQKYLFGMANGYFLLDLESYKNNRNSIFINKVTQKKADGSHAVLSLDKENELSFKDNSISFEFGTPVFKKYQIIDYQYLLDPYHTTWSEWTGGNHVNFENLPAGDYTFRVRSRSGNNSISDAASFNFVIAKPWALSTSAFVLYAILFILLGFLIHYTYRSYYRKQEAELIRENSKKLELQKLANEQELVKIRNDQLRQDIENKNRELAVSTMNLINKNEILGQIKKALENSKENGVDVRSVLRIIDQNINEEDNWNVFKDAFNNADKDFLDKVKRKHPALTPNDLRLCAYLRLNLASKEIAPLLNISPRSVEIKRYRLRKKMELPHEKSLAEYILEI